MSDTETYQPEVRRVRTIDIPIGKLYTLTPAPASWGRDRTFMVSGEEGWRHFPADTTHMVVLKHNPQGWRGAEGLEDGVVRNVLVLMPDGTTGTFWNPDRLVLVVVEETP